MWAQISQCSLFKQHAVIVGGALCCSRVATGRSGHFFDVLPIKSSSVSDLPLVLEKICALIKCEHQTLKQLAFNVTLARKCDFSDLATQFGNDYGNVSTRHWHRLSSANLDHKNINVKGCWEDHEDVGIKVFRLQLLIAACCHLLTSSQSQFLNDSGSSFSKTVHN